jgi:hypothetical protein
MLIFAAALAMMIAQPSAVPDPRSADAVALFDDMCVRSLLGQKTSGDPTRFQMMKVDEKDARETLPEFDADKAWGVVGTQSKVRMFVGSGHGMCAAEVLSADRDSVRAEFDQLVNRTATFLHSSAALEVQNDNPINGKPASYRAWRLKSPKGDIMLALTAASEGAADVQHLMTASYVK